jgi:choline kinase
MSKEEQHVKGVILAAGDGGRLGSLSVSTPKPLVEVAGKPLIEYTVRAFVQVGITDLVVVVGYRGEMVQAWLKDGATLGARVKYIWNPEYELGNGLSLWRARTCVQGERFVLSMADHMISADLLEQVLADAGTHTMLAVDRSARSVDCWEEATKVFVDEDGFIQALGKELILWNAVDTGVFLCQPSIFDLFADLPHGPELSEVMRAVIERERLRACDVSGAFWLDVDTAADLDLADRLMGEHGGARV